MSPVRVCLFALLTFGFAAQFAVYGLPEIIKRSPQPMKMPKSMSSLLGPLDDILGLIGKILGPLKDTICELLELVFCLLDAIIQALVKVMPNVELCGTLRPLICILVKIVKPIEVFLENVVGPLGLPCDIKYNLTDEIDKLPCNQSCCMNTDIPACLTELTGTINNLIQTLLNLLKV